MSRSIKTILVALNNPQFFENNMAMAKYIARQYDSHIIGLYVIPSAIIYTTPYGYIGPVTFPHLNDFYKTGAADAETKFRDYTKVQGLNAEWRTVTSEGKFISDAIIEHGRESDLIILGDDNSIDPEVQFQARIVMASGRPVLIVPNTVNNILDFGRAVIGWDGSREASRAVFDALPLLQMAKRVEVTCFDAHKEGEISGDTPGSELAKSLARHGVNATVVYEESKKSAASSIIERAEQSDILVMGAYGHSRLTEELFGGATLLALTKMPCNILMSH